MTPGAVLPTLDPPVDGETAPFWAAAARGRIELPVCGACGDWVWYPRSFCPRCHSEDLRWQRASGRGRVYSYSIVRRASGDWAAVAPYVVAYVELDEGPRLLTNVVSADAEALAIGQAVEAVFHRSPGGHALVRFRPLR